MARKPTTVAFWCGKLPHWGIEEGRYFVTIHLAGPYLRLGGVEFAYLPRNTGAWHNVRRQMQST